MNIKKKFLELTSQTYPHGTEAGLNRYLPAGHQPDGWGNFYLEIGSRPSTMFTCHLDTADHQSKRVNHIFEGQIIKTDGQSILGADDKAGMTLLLFMIQQAVPGLYYFFIGEERGCIGSRKAAASWRETEFSKYITKCISLDRRGTDSIITEQFGGTCCSDDFALALAVSLNKVESSFNYKPDPTGIYTDSAQFTDIIAECTNVSVGYYNEHSHSERQDIAHLEKLAQALCKVNWEELPTPGLNSHHPSSISTPATEKWSENNFLYHNQTPDTELKIFISRERIDYERELILKWLTGQDFLAGSVGLGWNGNTLYIDQRSGEREYLASRRYLSDMIPELIQIPPQFTKTQL